MLRERWQTHIDAALARPVLVVDEAQEMLSTVFSELRLLCSTKFDSHILLTVVLAGDGRLLERLRSDEFLPLASRMRPSRGAVAQILPALGAEALDALGDRLGCGVELAQRGGCGEPAIDYRANPSGRSSPRNVEDLLAERGIDISHETVRFWWNRFGPMFAAEIRKRRVAHMRGARRVGSARGVARAGVARRLCLGRPALRLRAGAAALMLFALAFGLVGVGREPALMRLVSGAAFLFLALMFFLSFIDLMTRLAYNHCPASSSRLDAT